MLSITSILTYLFCLEIQRMHLGAHFRKQPIILHIETVYSLILPKAGDFVSVVENENIWLYSVSFAILFTQKVRGKPEETGQGLCPRPGTCGSNPCSAFPSPCQHDWYRSLSLSYNDILRITQNEKMEASNCILLQYNNNNKVVPSDYMSRVHL